MKKTFGIFIVLLIAASPAYSLKLIVNDTSDRTVPSRSTAWNYDNYSQQSYSYTTAAPKDLSNLKLLSGNIRGELVGTTWYYPGLKPVETKTSSADINPYSKLCTREAADYYALDTIENPEKLVPIGYDE